VRKRVGGGEGGGAAQGEWQQAAYSLIVGAAYDIME